MAVRQRGRTISQIIPRKFHNVEEVVALLTIIRDRLEAIDLKVEMLLIESEAFRTKKHKT